MSIFTLPNHFPPVQFLSSSIGPALTLPLQGILEVAKAEILETERDTKVLILDRFTTFDFVSLKDQFD